MPELDGLKELTKKLNQLETKLAGKTLRSAVVQASLPAFRAIKLAAPVGTGAHRTYKGNLVGPGFLKRSVKRVSKINKRTGTVSVAIGVRAEAFYGIAFLDRGTIRITGRSWFKRNFVDNRSKMERRLVERLRAKIEQIARK